jgi:hypothetical protein
MKLIRGAHAVSEVEGNTGLRANASAGPAPRGLRTWHVRTLLAREPGDLGFEEQPTRLPILRGASPLIVNCPDLGDKHIRCMGRQRTVIGADVKATAARCRKTRRWELSVWRANLWV